MNDDRPAATALVILPFGTPEKAEQFAQLVAVQFGDQFAAPIVTAGTSYEYRDDATGETGQVFELFPESRWEAYVHQDDGRHHIIRRVTKEATDAGTG